jgi:hypothetical protein
VVEVKVDVEVEVKLENEILVVETVESVDSQLIQVLVLVESSGIVLPEGRGAQNGL